MPRIGARTSPTRLRCFLITVGRLKDRTLREIEFARGKRALATARELRYTSIYFFPTRGCTDIEGYFDFESKGSFPVWLVAGGAVNRWAISYWEDGDAPFDYLAARS